MVLNEVNIRAKLDIRSTDNVLIRFRDQCLAISFKLAPRQVFF